MHPLPASEIESDDFWGMICRQDPEAFERLQQLVAEVCPIVFMQPLVPPGEQERLLQDVLVSVWESAGKQIESPRNFRAFLKWRARGVLSQFRRERSKRGQEDLIDFDTTLTDAGLQPLEDLTLREMNNSLRRCHEELSPGLAEVWTARFERGLDSQETAKELSIEIGLVAVRLHRAKDSLRSCLERRGALR